MKYTSYPKVMALGHPAVASIFDGAVVITEKLDGSQFNFMMENTGDNLVLRAWSKGTELNLGAPERMFIPAVETVKRLADELVVGVIYRAEYLSKPKHNTLAYRRIPAQHLAVFDIQTGIEAYLNYGDMVAEASRLGLECVPLLLGHRGSDQFGFGLGEGVLLDILGTESFLGGTKIEGVVIKGYERYNPKTGFTLMAKYVSESFKEANKATWTKGESPIAAIIAAYNTPQRWAKAIEHLRDEGRLENSPRDIGKLVAEVKRDVSEECSDSIKEALYKAFWPGICRAMGSRLAEFYKKRLVEESFANSN